MKVVVPALPSKALGRQLPWISEKEGHLRYAIVVVIVDVVVVVDDDDDVDDDVVFISSFGSCRVTGMFAEEFIEQRRKGLEEFINK